jgi:hypothetical protein
VFEDENSAVCSEMFSQTAKTAQKLEVSLSNSSMIEVKLNHRENLDYGLLCEMGFIRDKVPGIASVLKTKY